LGKNAILRVLILAWLALASVSAGAESRLRSARDLAGEAASSARQGRVLLVLFSEPGCPWCERVRREFLLPMQSNAGYRVRVAFVQVDVNSTRALRDFGGHTTTHAEFARVNGVRLYPTVMLFGPAGQRLAEPLPGFSGPDFYGAYLDQRIDEAVGKLRTQ